MTPHEIIKQLNLQAHPEGGWFTETWRDGSLPRATGTAIYFLLEKDQTSHWHKVDATEIWHWYAGHPMELRIHENGATRTELLGPDLCTGQRPQVIVPTHAWQSSVPIGGWVLVGCTVSPGFEFSGFKLAPPDWKPMG
ncbi:MAG: cupin domain-containing protein [Rhodobacteraceae bacterium]|nr:cupin domain-containing protein [Paracoccaceae bacterium]